MVPEGGEPRGRERKKRLREVGASSRTHGSEWEIMDLEVTKDGKAMRRKESRGKGMIYHGYGQKGPG